MPAMPALLVKLVAASRASFLHTFLRWARLLDMASDNAGQRLRLGASRRMLFCFRDEYYACHALTADAFAATYFFTSSLMYADNCKMAPMPAIRKISTCLARHAAHADISSASRFSISQLASPCAPGSPRYHLLAGWSYFGQLLTIARATCAPQNAPTAPCFERDICSLMLIDLR